MKPAIKLYWVPVFNDETNKVNPCPWRIVIITSCGKIMGESIIYIDSLRGLISPCYAKKRKLNSHEEYMSGADNYGIYKSQAAAIRAMMKYHRECGSPEPEYIGEL